ncbi:MAG: hypothetical protein GWN87_11580, partial [Desulfuromonadales bacterium]|nr:hypothetical protein [Desulfuromonadales bacterium]
KAGATVSGTSLLQSAFSRQEVRFLIVAEDSAAGSSGKMIRLAELAGVGWGRFSNQRRLGQLAGKENRSCLGIKDEQFAELLALEIQGLQQIAGEN